MIGMEATAAAASANNHTHHPDSIHRSGCGVNPASDIDDVVLEWAERMLRDLLGDEYERLRPRLARQLIADHVVDRLHRDLRGC
jgi:hypothetical protein